MATQPDLFGVPSGLPEGLGYQPDFLTRDEEAALAEQLSAVPVTPFEFQGFLGKRRTASFGLHYAFAGGGRGEAAPIPPFLLPIRDRAARFAGLAAEALRHVLVIEYDIGAGIGWHRDRPEFDDVVGISLIAPARLRFRRKRGSGWERASLMAEPGSAYLLRGPARSEWEHSIAPMDRLRYSITFRSLRGPAPATGPESKPRNGDG